MTAGELAKLFEMQPHKENGSYVERHYPDVGGVRPASGAIYYFLGNEEKARFHVIDCDEYWNYVAGSDLELWLVAEGQLTKKVLGLGPGREPLVYIPKGTIFGAKHFENAADGTFVTCITVPRFDYRGWRMLDGEEMVKICPATKDF